MRFRNYAFVDPGATTGVVALSVPTEDDAPERPLRTWNLTARWVGGWRVRGSASKKLTGPEQDARLFEDVRALLAALDPAVVVLEEPVDALPTWNKGGDGAPRASGRGTIFSLGRNYGLCLAAASALHRTVRIYAHVVSGSKERPGWMPKVRGGRNGNMVHTMKRADLLALLRERVESYRDRPDDGVLVPRALRGELSEHELMAFGVGHFHLERVTRGV